MKQLSFLFIEKLIMIEKAFEFISSTLDQFLKNKFGLDENKVIINSIVDIDGASPIANKNKVVISLINIERESLKPFYNRNKKSPSGAFSAISPVEYYNFTLLVSSNFDDYKETLKFLNATVLFFQMHPSINSSTFSNIPKGLDKLDFELERVDYQQMHSLWSALGAKYRPSVIYKTKMIIPDGDEALNFDAVTNQSSKTVSL